MAFANQGRSIPQVGLRRTLRFQWRSSDREVMPRDLFCTRIIKGQLNLTVEDVFCIQWHQQATGYDVSFVSAETHQAVTARFLDWLSTVPGSAPPRCSRFCCTQMLKVLKGFSTPLHSPAEAIRADASVRVTLVPGGGDLRADMLSSVLHLACVFPLPVAIRRPLARKIFDFLWGGRYEWVALGRMMSGLAEGGRDVPDLPLKLDTIFVASLLQDMASEVGHPASIDKIHWHGLGRSPLCPRPSCGAGETAYHVMWECSFARQLWAKAKKVVGRAKPDLTLTSQVVERGFVGAHIRKKGAMAGKTGARTEWSGVEWSTERVAKGVEWEVTERMKLDVDKLGYHAAKEKWKGGFGLL
ncbi:hypothetical protein Q8A73_024198 [Channa argus]|nr:hypothetical protein Q8A73_024198 [Channa argus]